MISVDFGRLMHRHGDEWVPMVPTGNELQDPGDAERQMLRGAQVYHCEGCDEEISVEVPSQSG
jgi:hypothetical protein